MTIIDTHQHFWYYDPERDAWMTEDMSVLWKNYLPEDFKIEMDRVNVHQSVAVQASQSMEETHFLLELANEHSFISGVVGWIDLQARNLKDLLSPLRDNNKLKGFRHILQSDPKLMEERRFIKGVSLLGEYNFTYDLLIYYNHLRSALSFAKKVSKHTPIVIDHLAKPSIKTGEFDYWAKGITALAELDNVYCKVSGMITEADWKTWSEDSLTKYIDHVFEVFGPSRVMYGSDWPVCLVAGSYTDQFNVVNNYMSKLSYNEKTLFMGENAKHFYNL